MYNVNKTQHRSHKYTMWYLHNYQYNITAYNIVRITWPVNECRNGKYIGTRKTLHLNNVIIFNIANQPYAL